MKIFLIYILSILISYNTYSQDTIYVEPVPLETVSPVNISSCNNDIFILDFTQTGVILLTFNSNGSFYCPNTGEIFINIQFISINLNSNNYMDIAGDNINLQDVPQNNIPSFLTLGTSGNILIDVNVSTGSIIGQASCECITPLPVDLIEFKGFLYNNIGHLEWSTASEINSDYFIIERSIDGINYECIGNISASGNSSNIIPYKYKDNNIIIGKDNYYRLIQVDYNGHTDIYNPIVIKTINENRIFEYYNILGQKIESDKLEKSIPYIKLEKGVDDIIYNSSLIIK